MFALVDAIPIPSVYNSPHADNGKQVYLVVLVFLTLQRSVSPALTDSGGGHV